MKVPEEADDTVHKNKMRDARNIWSGVVVFCDWTNEKMKNHNMKCGDFHTSRRSTHACPPPTCSPTQVTRAFSINKSALATHRSASMVASGSFFREVDRASSVDKLAGVATISDPAGILPKVFTAKRALAASKTE